MMNQLKFIVFLFCLILSTRSFAQSQPTVQMTRILFIMDMSNSMNGEWQSGKKIDIARKIFGELLDSLKEVPNLQMALRMYGHQSHFEPQDCNDTKLEVPFGLSNAEAIRKKLFEISPKGTTPIARSLQACAADFPPCRSCKNVVILITDGIEACNGDPCAIALALKQKGISLRPYVIGIGLDVELIEAFKCVGQFYDATDEKTFKTILNTVVTEVTNQPTTAQVNLLDINGKPTETNVNYCIIDQATNKVENNYVHSLNAKGNPDTLILRSSKNYKITVFTIPPVSKENIKVKAGKHNIIPISTPQGTLLIREQHGTSLEGTPLIVRQSGECQTLNIQTIRNEEKYIVGKYDIELHTLPKIYYKNVEIKQSQTTELVVPNPGKLTVSMASYGYASLYRLKGKQQIWLKNLYNTTRIAFNLQPGQYLIVYRPVKINNSFMTKTKIFNLESGASEWIRF